MNDNWSEKQIKIQAYAYSVVRCYILATVSAVVNNV